LVLSRNKRIFFAVIAGILIAGTPMAAFNYWLSELVARQGQDEVDLSARRTITIVEERITRVLSVLDELVARGVDSCKPAHLDILRRTTLATIPIKELSIVAPDGGTLCTDHGLSLGPRFVITSQRIGANDTFLDVLRLNDKAAVRIRRATQGGFANIAALMPAELFMAQTSTHGGPIVGYARISTRDGTTVHEKGAMSDSAMGDDRLISSLNSDRFGLNVSLAIGRTTGGGAYGDMHSLGMVATGVIAILLCAFALLVPREYRKNPIDDMERGLKAGEFVPYYQPIVDITTGKLMGAEVLVRWKKSDGTMISPGAFIPLAESSGMIIALTRSLMYSVREEIGSALASRPDFKIGFNLAAQHFRDEKIVSDVQAIFGKAQIRLSQVVLEVTERQPLENLTVARRVIAALQGIGVRIAIDDVGTGHSGLSYMLKLGVDILKIDKMFIDALGNDANSTAIIETLINLARNMRMEIVAEGVETFEQVVSLRERGIHAAQGFVFAPPLPGASFLQLLEAIDPKQQAGGAQKAGPTGNRQRPAA
jgi:sensor c-di-GMP phosphodiesterase-like protein